MAGNRDYIYHVSIDIFIEYKYKRYIICTYDLLFSYNSTVNNIWCIVIALVISLTRPILCYHTMYTMNAHDKLKFR